MGGVVLPGPLWPSCAPPPPDKGDFTPAQAARLIAGNVSPVGVTSDNYLIYREGSKAMAVRLGVAGGPFVIADSFGLAFFKGRVAFFWSNLDYVENRGDLLAWTGGDCPRPLGRVPISEGVVEASADGSMLLFATNVTSTAFDLEVAARDLSWRHILLAHVPRATDTTCGAQYRFAGGRVVASYCDAGGYRANLNVFEGGAQGWQMTPIAQDVYSWSPDATGENVFYTTTDADASLWGGQGASAITVDGGVSWGVLLPDASAVLYTVGNQLRRSALPPVNDPIPIVTTKFNRVQRWSADFSHVLYSTQSTYEGGERYDLLLTPTAAYNPSPRKLVTAVDAALSRDAFSADGQFVAFLTGISAGERTLHLHAVASGQERTVPSVGTVAAGRGGVFVFSTNLSGPGTYPATSSLRLVNAASTAPPQTIEAKVLNHSSFFVARGGRAVVYQR
ncbi:MAG TPA: hypothetical protein VFS00_32755, partial [Polyangiaceae bacterium]|nr:hypothetical protein [Polyangiaceae bacterium]